MNPLRLPHMTIALRRDRVALHVPDVELRDLVEDHLVTCDIEYEWLEPAEEGAEASIMIFPKDITFSQVTAALNRLEPSEVERTFRINNSRDPAEHTSG
jgi:hypothetical protein